MRFLTKQLYYSVHFYRYFRFKLDLKYEELLQMHMEGYSDWEEYNKGIDTALYTYRDHVNEYFNEYILYSSEVRDIIYDENGELIEFNSSIYYKLKDLQIKFIELRDLYYETVRRNAQDIFESNVSEEIKAMARLNKHDGKILYANLYKKYLELIIKYGEGQIKYFKFKLSKLEGENLDILSVSEDYKIILDEEIFLAGNKVFEYNILIANYSKYYLDQLEEVSINFTDVEIRDIVKRRGINMDNEEKINGSQTLVISLKELIDMKEIVLIYSDKDDTESFSAGYIKLYSENEILVFYIDPFGNYNGISVKRIEDIIKIEYGGKYSNKIKKLNALKNEEINLENIEEESLFISALLYAMKNKKIVIIEILKSKNEDAVGYVISFGDNILKMELINSYGERDGKILIDIRNITHLTCDGEYEKSLDILATNNESF